MNRADLQTLSTMRSREANVLFEAGEYSGSYYLAGYSVECALKACFAKRTQRYEFPDKQMVAESYTHDLLKLISVVKLSNELLVKRKADSQFDKNCNRTFAWSERSRYSHSSEQDAKAILDSISEPGHGVLQWITQYW